MPPSIALRSARVPAVAVAPALGRLRRIPLAMVAAAAAVLALLAVCLPINHDEAQYVAPAVMAARLRPYIDFAYLQTPLQLYLTAPLAGLAQGWSFLALRLANAAMGAGVLALIYAAQRRLGAPRDRALLAAGLLLVAYPFEFAAAAARNDALPALLLAGAMLAGLAALEKQRRTWRLWSLAGLLLGAATSAKVSYVLPLGFVGLFLLWRTWRAGERLSSPIGFGLGGLLGMTPAGIAFLSAPGAFVWSVFTYAEDGATYWYRLIGEGSRLALANRVLEGAFHLAVGPALAVLIGVVLITFGKARERASPQVRYLQVLALAGLAAAFAPSPMQRQYVLPMLPPLFVLWGATDPLARAGPLARRILLALLALGVAVGLGRIGYVLGDAGLWLLKGRAPPALALSQDAHWIGASMRAAGRQGPIVTPSPHAVADSGEAIDARFASGGFPYRSGDLLTDAEQRRLHLASPRTLARFLDEAPPAAIVTGFEPLAGRSHRNIDDDFRAYARARGYRRLVGPDGQVELWIRA